METRHVGGKLRTAFVFAALLAPSAWLAWNFRDMPQLGTRHDDALYWVCAKALAEGRGYRILSLPGEPHQTKYPPLYPWLLSAIWRLDPDFPANLRWAALAAWLPLPLWLWLSRRFFLRCGFSSGAAWLLTALVALNPYTLIYSLVLMTEIPFGCALLGISLLLEGGDGKHAGLRRAAMAGALAAATYLMRTAALPWLVAGPCWLALRKRYREAAVFAAMMMLAIAGWTWWGSAHATTARDEISLYYTNYLGYHLANFGLADLPLLLRVNGAGLLEAVAGLLLFGILPGWEGKLLAAVVAGSAIGGVLLAVRRHQPGFLVIYGCLYFGMLLSWHLTEHDQFERLILPTLPLFLCGVGATLALICQQMRAWWKRGDPARLVLLAAVGLAAGWVAWHWVLMYTAALAQIRGKYELVRRDFQAQLVEFEALRRGVAQHARVLSLHDVVVYLYTGRQGACPRVPSRLLYTGDEDAIRAYIAALPAFARDHGFDYIYWRRPTGASTDVGHKLSLPISAVRAYLELGERLAEYPGLAVIHRAPTFGIYRVLR
jgi:hypothetical protein